MTFRAKLQVKIEAWKLEHGQTFCPRGVRSQLEADLRAVDPPSRRGFAALTDEERREVASRGGHSASHRGNAHRFTPETARVAGVLGGQASHAYGGAHRFNSETGRAANLVARERQQVAGKEEPETDA